MALSGGDCRPPCVSSSRREGASGSSWDSSVLAHPELLALRLSAIDLCKKLYRPPNEFPRWVGSLSFRWPMESLPWVCQSRLREFCISVNNSGEVSKRSSTVCLDTFGFTNTRFSTVQSVGTTPQGDERIVRKQIGCGGSASLQQNARYSRRFVTAEVSLQQNSMTSWSDTAELCDVTVMVRYSRTRAIFNRSQRFFCLRLCFTLQLLCDMRDNTSEPLM